MKMRGRKLIGKKKLRQLRNPIGTDGFRVRVNMEKPKMLEIVRYFPNSLQSDVRKLLEYILKFDIIQMGHKGELIYKGQSINRSSFKDLIRHAMSNTSIFLPGIEKFYKGLHDIDVPSGMIRNKYGVKMFEKLRGDWRPPGVLVKSGEFPRRYKRKIVPTFSYDKT